MVNCILSWSFLSTFHSLSRSTLRREVNSFESSVEVQKLEFAINLSLYGL